MPVPYLPESLDTTKARLVTRDAESTTGAVTNERVVASNNWAWGRCSSANADLWIILSLCSAASAATRRA